MALFARLGDRSHGLFDDVGQSAFLVARRRVGGAVGLTERQIIVVPGHLAQQRAADLFVGGARGQQVNCVAHFGDF